MAVRLLHNHALSHHNPAADSSVKMVFEPQPQPRIVAALNEKTVTQASTACTAVGAALYCASVPLLGTWGPLQMLNRGQCIPQCIPACQLMLLRYHQPLQIAVGYNHTVAVASDGGVWTWGFGGYGRLGHKVQQVRTLTFWSDSVAAECLAGTKCRRLGHKVQQVGPRLAAWHGWRCMMVPAAANLQSLREPWQIFQLNDLEGSSSSWHCLHL